MIRGTILRLFGAGGLCLLGLATFAGGSSSGIGILLLAVGFIWGTILLFVLSAQLLEYGLSGIVHDINGDQEHDPWNRW